MFKVGDIVRSRSPDLTPGLYGVVAEIIGPMGSEWQYRVEFNDATTTILLDRHLEHAQNE